MSHEKRFLIAPLQILVTVATIVLVMGVGLFRAMHPSLHMDESLYLGASLRMLHGDPLLTSYWLDKIPFAPIFMTPGILIAGENALGFHLSGLLASITGVLVAQSLIREFFARSALGVAAQVFYLGVILAPFMVFHHASSFTDPFLLLFLLLFLRAAWRCLDSTEHREELSQEKKAYFYFNIALLIKFSALMWSPVLLGFWLIKYGARWWQEGPRRLARAGLYPWALAFAYMLANPGKLAPVLWFSQLVAKDQSRASSNVLTTLFGRMADWAQISLDILDSRPAFILLAVMILALTAVTLYSLQKALRGKRLRSLQDAYDLIHRASPAARSLVLLFVVPFWAHAFGLCLSGAALFPRYLYILIPQMILSIIYGVSLLPTLLPRGGGERDHLVRRVSLIGVVAPIVLAAALVLAHGLDLGRQWAFVTQSTALPESARELYKIRDELPRQSVIHHDSRLWFLYPFIIKPGIRPACREPSCLVETQLGRAPFDRQYILAESPDHSVWQLKYLEPQADLDAPFHRRETTVNTYDMEIPVERFLDENMTRETLRIYGWAQSLTWEVGVCSLCAPRPSLAIADLPTWTEARDLPEVPVTLTIQVKSGSSSLLPKSVRLGGHLTLTRGTAANPHTGDDRWHLALRLEHIDLGNADINLVDVAPVVYEGYVIPLGLVDIDETHLGSFGAVRELSWKASGDKPHLVATILRETSKPH